MSEKLKPCPFCGGEASIYKFDKGYFVAEVADTARKLNFNFFVGCNNCKTAGYPYKTKRQAIEAWNRRV